MRFTPHLLDEIRARLPVSQVVGRKVPLKKKGREFAGLSPFKSEKTPSFFVNDQKGFYHCFASGEHGDIFTFLIKTEGLSFPEAVERLAEEAGVVLPKSAPQDQAKEDERQRLYRLLTSAANYFCAELTSAKGRHARDYLRDRGLQDSTIERFNIGFAPNDRHALSRVLKDQGFTTQDLATSGMLISGEDIREPYDRFRGRVMFPITDVKGRVIAFGGRALDPSVPAKYLNSPETPLFHKSNVLFNAKAAREAGYEKKRIIAVEGYMDVVALNEAGFTEAVAPLGTALTEEQIRLLWRVAPEPILCFDGDAAGRKAAERAVDTVLPHIAPGQSLSFAFLPDGLDPDDLVRQHGADAFEKILSRARPLADVLFERAWRAGDWSTPERRAQLDASLRESVARIREGGVRAHYERDMRNRVFEALRGAQQSTSNKAPQTKNWNTRQTVANSKRNGGQGPDGRQANGGRSRQNMANKTTPAYTEPTDQLKESGMVTEISLPPREALILRTLLNHPWLIDVYAEDISAIGLTAAPLQALRDAILSAHAVKNPLDRSALRSQLQGSHVEKYMDMVEHAATHRGDRFAEPDADSAEAEHGWRHTLALHRNHELHHSLRAAERAWEKDGSDEAFTRIREIKNDLARLSEKWRSEDNTGEQIGTA